MTAPTDSIPGSDQGGEPTFPSLRVLGNRIFVSPARQGNNIEGSPIQLAERYRPEQQIYFIMQLGTGIKDRNLMVGMRVVLDQYKLTSRVPAGPGLFIIDAEAINCIFP